MSYINLPSAVWASTSECSYALAHTHILNRSQDVGFPQTVNEYLHSFHFHWGFFCAGKSCVWLITVGLECAPSWPDERSEKWTEHTHTHHHRYTWGWQMMGWMLWRPIRVLYVSVCVCVCCLHLCRGLNRFSSRSVICVFLTMFYHEL